MNTTMHEFLLNTYNARSATHDYIFGFTYNGTVYYTERQSSSLALFLKLDKASRGKGYCLRFKPTKAQKTALLIGAQVLCSTEYFAEAVAESKYNKGEVFEKMLTERAGQEWHKDNIEFTKQGDLQTNGKDYQLKFEGASFITEKQAMGL